MCAVVWFKVRRLGRCATTIAAQILSGMRARFVRRAGRLLAEGRARAGEPSRLAAHCAGSVAPPFEESGSTMVELLIFSLTLLAAVLVYELADRTVISSPAKARLDGSRSRRTHRW